MSLKLVRAMPSVAYVDRRSLLPDAPGLYFAIRADVEMLYIGMSAKSIRRRWKASFHDGGCQIEKRDLGDRTRIAYLVYDDTSTLVEDEKAAIREFSPTFNVSHVPGAYERLRRREAEECRVINCHDHFHDTIPQTESPTEWGKCDCPTPSCALYPSPP